MKNRIRIAEQNESALVIVGHVGVGHVHSYSGCAQNDSAGFVAAAEMMREATGADTRVSRVAADAAGYIVVETAGGGLPKYHGKGRVLLL